LNNFPTIKAPSFPSEEDYIHKTIATTFENGIEFARRTSTIGKHKFTLTWENLSETDFQTLKSFFISQGAEPFNWTHPVSNVTHKVRFPMGNLASKHILFGRRSTSIELHEIPNA
jgi:hypothetical protein